MIDLKEDSTPSSIKKSVVSPTTNDNNDKSPKKKTKKKKQKEDTKKKNPSRALTKLMTSFKSQLNVELDHEAKIIESPFVKSLITRI